MITPTTQYWYLRDHKLFNNLSNDDLHQVCFIANFKKSKKGDIIRFSADNKGLMFSLKKGSIKIIQLNEDGSEQVKDIISKGDLFGQLNLDEDFSDNEYAIVTSSEAILCSFKAEEFSKYLETKPNLALKYTKWMGWWFKRLENRYSNILFKDVNTRLLHFLKDGINGQTPTKNGEYVISYGLTHQDIASLICSTRQTVTSLFNNLKKDGVLDYNRNEIIINEKKFLQQF
jgi:CRP/FNR family transcriptional regulator, cyclic AMP receptor protein